MTTDGLGQLRWFPVVGLVLGFVSFLGALSGVRRAVVAVVPIAWTLLIVFLPAFGLGLLVAPVALGTAIAAAVPDRLPVVTRERAVRAVLWGAVVILIVVALVYLSGTAPGSP